MSKQYKAEWSTPEFIEERIVDFSSIGKTIKSRGIKFKPFVDNRKLRPSRKSLVIWNPSRNRTKRELKLLSDDVRKAKEPAERSTALWKLRLAYMTEDGLAAIREENSIALEYGILRMYCLYKPCNNETLRGSARN